MRKRGFGEGVRAGRLLGSQEHGAQKKSHGPNENSIEHSGLLLVSFRRISPPIAEFSSAGDRQPSAVTIQLESAKWTGPRAPQRGRELLSLAQAGGTAPRRGSR